MDIEKKDNFITENRIAVSLAGRNDRDIIYKLRHDIYACELKQHSKNSKGKINDVLDSFNIYITAKINGEIIGFVSITPPKYGKYSIDKYFSREDIPVCFDGELYEIRLLTVLSPYRGYKIAGILMYAALRWIDQQGGRRIVAIGREEILDLYLKAGLTTLGHRVQSGAVKFELLGGEVKKIHLYLNRYNVELKKLEHRVNWQLEVPFYKKEACFHGGAFFEAIGVDFDHLEKSRDIINADVLDAWFSPSPKVIAALNDYLPWLIRTSPPTQCEGMVKAIASTRCVNSQCILPGAGSSDLIFLSLSKWLTRNSRVLILNPMYGEYEYILEKVLGCQVDHITLLRNNGYMLDISHLEKGLRMNYDMVILVNPNSPTGRHVPIGELKAALKHIPHRTIVWIDETYVEYAGLNQSLEHFATQRSNVIICKSMSKVYALSGLRCAYLCSSPEMIEPLRKITPPWAVSLPAQIAAVKALQDPQYYNKCYMETHVLREALVKRLQDLQRKIEIVSSVANFILCHLPSSGPDAATFVNECKKYNLFIRDASSMGSHLGSHAIRIAVKDQATIERMIDIIRHVLVPK